MVYSTMNPIHLLFLIIPFVCSCYQEKTVQHFTKNVTNKYFTGAPVATYKAEIIPKEYDGLYYAMCERGPLHIGIQYFYNATCNVTVEAWPSPDRTLSRNCLDIKIDVEDHNWMMSRHDPVQPYLLNKEKFLFITNELLNIENETTEKTRERFTIIDMVTCAKTSFVLLNFKDPIGSSLSSPVIYNNKFSFIITSKATCDGHEKCLLTYDFEGTRIGNPKPLDIHTTSVGDVFSVDDLTSEKGFYMVSTGIGYKTERIWFVDPTGTAKALAELQVADSSVYHILTPDFLPIHITSSAHELFSYCRNIEIKRGIQRNVETSMNFHCLQFDNTTTTMNFKLELPEPTGWISVHNLVNGGMLVVTVDCRSDWTEQPARSGGLCREFKVWTIRNDRNQYKPLLIKGFDFKCVLDERISMKSSQIIELEHEYCFVFGCQHFSRYYHHKTCVDKKYIAVPNLKISFY